MTGALFCGQMRRMQDVTALAAHAARVTAVFTDIDDTLTTSGKLDAAAFSSLWRLQQAGIKVVPVTGRPAGWCDAIARQWPVDGVIGENGALAFYERNGRLEQLWHPSVAERDSLAGRLASVRKDILARMPGARVAKDQPYRMFDLAIDFAEEPPHLGMQTAADIAAIFAEHGAKAKVSSIHVNGWFGDYDKLAMAELYVRQLWGHELATERQRYVFCGDSPNDEPMFAYFPLSCGVANVAAFASQLTHLPAYVTRQPGGEGFAEMVEVLLRSRVG